MEASGAQATTAAASGSSACDNADVRLFSAVTAGDLEAARAAVADGASVRAQGDDGQEPIHLACSNLNIAQWLHSAGASLDAADGNDNTPLHAISPAGRASSASPSGCTARAFLSMPSTAMDTLLHLACDAGHLSTVHWLHSAGASLDATDNSEDTPLHLACESGHLDIAQWLCRVGASVDATNDLGQTLLHNACSGDHLDVAQWMHSLGASLDATDSDGYTPLHFACFNGSLDMIQWFCSAGADATLKSNDGNTPAQLLQQRGPRNRDKQAFGSTMNALLAAESRGVEEWARAAEAALLAEEAAPPSAASKGKSKAKAKGKSRAQDGPAPAQTAAGSSSDLLPPASPPPSDIADAALRVAIETRDLEALKAAINQSAGVASDAVLKEARALREQLKQRELKAKKQLKREAEAARVREAALLGLGRPCQA